MTQPMSKQRFTRRLKLTVMSRDEERAKETAKKMLGSGEWDIHVQFVGNTEAWITATSK